MIVDRRPDGALHVERSVARAQRVQRSLGTLRRCVDGKEADGRLQREQQPIGQRREVAIDGGFGVARIDAVHRHVGVVEQRAQPAGEQDQVEFAALIGEESVGAGIVKQRVECRKINSVGVDAQMGGRREVDDARSADAVGSQRGQQEQREQKRAAVVRLEGAVQLVDGQVRRCVEDGGVVDQRIDGSGGNVSDAVGERGDAVKRLQVERFDLDGAVTGAEDELLANSVSERQIATGEDDGSS